MFREKKPKITTQKPRELSLLGRKKPPLILLYVTPSAEKP